MSGASLTNPSVLVLFYMGVSAGCPHTPRHNVCMYDCTSTFDANDSFNYGEWSGRRVAWRCFGDAALATLCPAVVATLCRLKYTCDTFICIISFITNAMLDLLTSVLLHLCDQQHNP